MSWAKLYDMPLTIVFGVGEGVIFCIGGFGQRQFVISVLSRDEINDESILMALRFVQIVQSKIFLLLQGEIRSYDVKQITGVHLGLQLEIIFQSHDKT